MKKITSLLCVVLGIVILILGISAKAEPVNNCPASDYYVYNPDDYYLSSASFGADFYTYIYRGVDTAVDELNDINTAMGEVVRAEEGIYAATLRNIDATDALNDTVNRYGSLLLIAIGLAVIAYGLVSTGKAFTKEPAPRRRRPAPAGEHSPSYEAPTSKAASNTFLNSGDASAPVMESYDKNRNESSPWEV